MRVLVLCDSNKKCPIKPHVAGAFAEAFLDAFAIVSPHTIAYNRLFDSKEENIFIFNHYPDSLNAMFKNRGPDWAFSFHTVTLTDNTPHRELVLITRPMHVSEKEVRKVLNMIRLAIPDASTRLMVSLEEITDMYTHRIDDLLDENIDLRLKVSNLKKELSLLTKAETDDACNN